MQDRRSSEKIGTGNFAPNTKNFRKISNGIWIGHLQRNKVKYIADKAALIHSVDSLRLAETINHEGEKIQRVIPVLIEVNVAQEETKFGVSVEETMSLIEEIC